MLTSSLLLCLAVSAKIALGSPVLSDSEDEDSNLRWYRQYNVEVEKISVLGGVAENIKVWYLPHMKAPRIKSSLCPSPWHRLPACQISYRLVKALKREEIHPKTTQDGNKDKKVCRKITLETRDRTLPLDVLPDTMENYFEKVAAGCEESNTIQHNLNDEAVTTHLHFIDPDNETHVDHVFTAFKNKYNKDYSHDDKEHALRRKIFQDNMRLISKTNNQNLGYKLAVNQFSDKTEEESKRMRGLKRRPPGEVGTEAFPYTKEDIDQALENLPREYDARDEGLVSYVKNQLECGSCWTFATTVAVEGAVARSAGQLMRLSNQAILDCAWDYGGDGCEGGSDYVAYRWIMNNGLPTEEEYGTYSNAENYCNIKNMSKLYSIRGFVDVTPKSVGALKVALVNHGPVSASVNSSDQRFLQYSSGIFKGSFCSETGLDHEVALVGYGDHLGEPYWILKNSWGPEWGIGGYMLISAEENTCGVMTEPTYVIV